MSGITIPWLGYSFMTLGMGLAVYYVYTLFKERQISKDNITKNKGDSIPNIKTGAILQIERREFKYKLPVLLNIFAVSCILLVLGFGINEIYLWIVGKASVQFNIWTILFLVLFIIFPTYAIVEPLFKEPKYYRLFRNCTAKDAEFITYGVINKIFYNCCELLSNMNANFIRIKEPKILKATLGKYNVIIEIRRRKGSMVRVYVLIYAFGVAVSSDEGTIQNYVDVFKNMLYHSHGS